MRQESGTEAQREAYDTTSANPAGALPVLSTWDVTSGVGHGNKWVWGGSAWVQTHSGGAAHSNITNGLANKTIALAAAGTYNATEVHGFMVLVAASDAWTLTFTEDGTTRSIPAAALALGQIYPFELSEITAGTGGEALLFLP